MNFFNWCFSIIYARWHIIFSNIMTPKHAILYAQTPRVPGGGCLGRHAPQVVCTSKFYIICFGRKQGSKLYFGQIAGKMGGQNYTFVSPWSSNIIVAQTLAEAGCPVQVSDFFDHLRWWARYARSECVPETCANTEDNAVEVGHTNTS